VEKGRLLTIRALAPVFALVGALVFFATVSDCAAAGFGGPRNRDYDPRHGGDRAKIEKYFNLHRGRWWNYYYRGVLYLAYGHYDKALDDFDAAVRKRSRDGRDVRTYGMHFTDYFPRRESGVAYYLQGESETNRGRKEEHYRNAVRELEKSLGQERSARAKHYLNQANRALWRLTPKSDAIAPVIHVKTPAYTNRRSVRLTVTVTDDNSGVGEIRVDRAAGEVVIEADCLAVDVPEKEITKMVDLALGPGARMAVVLVTASDLAGNRSQPSRVVIFLDLEPPTADFNVVGGGLRADGPIEIFIDARDDFGLKRVEVGQDPVRAIECNSVMRFSDTVTGRLKGRELRIALTDNAGNTTATSVPIEPSAQRPLAVWPLSPPDRPRFASASRSPLWSRGWVPVYLPGLTDAATAHPVLLDSASEPGITLLAAAGASEQRGGGPAFWFDKDVKRRDGMPVETSNPVFTVAGSLQNPRDIDLIRIHFGTWQREFALKSIDRNCEFHILRPFSVDLRTVAIGESRVVKVEAYRGGHYLDEKPSLSEALAVTRVKDVSCEDDAICGLLVLPLSLSKENIYTAPERSSDWGPLDPDEFYRDILAQLRSLPVSCRLLADREFPKAFNVYDVNQVYETTDIATSYRSPSDVVDDLRRWRKNKRRSEPDGIHRIDIDPMLIDLVVFGDLTLYSGLGRSTVRDDGEPRGDFTADESEEEATITLRAMSVEAPGEYLRFFPRGTDAGAAVPVLADTVIDRRTVSEHECQALALDIAKRMPRLQAGVRIDEAGGKTDKQRLSFAFGHRDGVFAHMKLWLYEKEGIRNTKLTKLACLDLEEDEFDSGSSRIKCDKDLVRRLEPDRYAYDVIAK